MLNLARLNDTILTLKLTGGFENMHYNRESKFYLSNDFRAIWKNILAKENQEGTHKNELCYFFSNHCRIS